MNLFSKEPFMQLISVNLGQKQSIENAKKMGMTGIYKQPVLTPVQITINGLSEDAICDTQNHGGPDQAVYIYGQPEYLWWSNELGHELLPGTFGENLTISGLESASYSIGDRLQVGGVTLEVTAPRIPCETLAARMDDPGFVKRFRAAERPGLYCRVIRAGWVHAGDSVRLERYPRETVSILEMFRDFYEPPHSEPVLRRYLAAPIAIRARRDKQEQLRKLLKARSTELA
jgi:MOSC domain-containing protein YiiM